METDKIVLPIVMTKNFTRKLSKGDSTKKNKKKRIVSSPKIYDADDHEEIYNSSMDLNAILGKKPLKKYVSTVSYLRPATEHKAVSSPYRKNQ